MQLKKLERVLEGIWSGELPHTQGYYSHQGMRCVAGWVFFFEHGHLNFWRAYIEKYKNELLWDKAKKILEINEDEATLLFSGISTETLHRLTLKAFQEGRRLKLENESLRIQNLDWLKGYSSKNVFLYDSLEIEKVSAFLNKPYVGHTIKI